MASLAEMIRGSTQAIKPPSVAGSIRQSTQAIQPPAQANQANAITVARPPAPPAPPQYPTLAIPGGGGGGGGGYDSAFRSSLQQARTGIEAQLRNALGEVARQEAAQREMVDQLPGQYAALHGQATGQATQLAKDADAAQAKIGPAPGTSSEGAIAPILAAMAMAQSTQQAGVPTLQLAVQDNAARQRGGLEQMRLSTMADLAAQEAQLSASSRSSGSDDSFRVASMQNDAALGRYQADLAAYENQQGNALDDRRRDEDFGRQLTLRDLDEAASATPARRFGAAEVSAERGGALRNVDRYRRDSAYTKLVSALRGRTIEEVPAVVAAFEKANKKASPAAMSMALFDLFGQPQAQ